MQDFSPFMVKQGVFGAEEFGFAHYGLCGGVACQFCYYQTARCHSVSSTLNALASRDFEDLDVRCGGVDSSALCDSRSTQPS